MAAATDTSVVRHDRFIEDIPLKANTVFRKKDIVLTQDADGLAVSAPAANCHCAGVASEDKDNTGGLDSAINTRVEQGVFLFKNSSGDAVTITEVAKKALCYAEDNQTVCKTAAGKSPVGRIVGLNEFTDTSGTSLGVLVEVGPYS